MRILVTLALVSACSQSTHRASTLSAPSRGVVIMSMRDVEPYEHVPPPAPKPPPSLELAAPLYGAVSGAVFGLVLHTGYVLLAERRMPDDRTRDREGANKALLYGAGIGLAGGTFALANSIEERRKWRARQAREETEKQR